MRMEMKKPRIPSFKTSETLLDDIELPCLHAEVKNSKLPGVAGRHIAKYKDDPECNIYLRAKKPTEMTPWQSHILEDFFSGGLAPAINEAMKEYEQDGDAYFGMTKSERQRVEKDGIAPFMTISDIIIDEVKKEVIMVGRTEWDGNLIEHGVSIYLRKGHWHFDDADYYLRYIDRVEPKAARLKRDKKELEKMAEEFSEIGDFIQTSLDRSTLWEELFPLPDPETPYETDVSSLYGDWKFDASKTRSVLKKLKFPKDEVDLRIEMNEELGDPVYRYSTKCVEVVSDGEITLMHYLCECDRRGNRLSLRCQIPNMKKDAIINEKYWFDGKHLVDEAGTAMRRLRSK